MGGARFERDFVNLTTNHGFASMRCPSSGSATDRDLPDVIALKGEGSPGDDYDGPAYRWAAELKARKHHIIYLDKSEIDALKRFATDAGITPYIGCRWKRAPGWTRHTDDWNATAWYLIPPEECERTDTGRYKVTRPDKRGNPDCIMGRAYRHRRGGGVMSYTIAAIGIEALSGVIAIGIVIILLAVWRHYR